MPNNGQTILVVDDDETLLPTVVRTLELAGYRVLSAREFRSGQRLLQSEPIDVLLLDYLLPGIAGLEALEIVHREHPMIPVLLITAYPEYTLAVQAMKLGAFDFIPKPFSPPDKLLVAVRNACERMRLERDRQLLIGALQEQYSIVGDSPVIRSLLDKLNRVARTDTTVLLLGETGTGKELAARMIHTASRRAASPFIAINCAAVYRELIESEMFGHKKGSFTGAIGDKLGKFKAAHGGTIFLDEIGDMESSLQAKVLRALQEREVEPVGAETPEKVDVRVVAATNKDLPTLVSDGKFRQDLYYRLNSVLVSLPALRDHLEDLPALLDLFLVRLSNEQNLRIPLIKPCAIEALMRHKWPGNVRELNSFANWIMTLGGHEITAHDVAEWRGQKPLGMDAPETSTNYRAAKEEFEREYFKRLLKLYSGNVTAVSRHAGLDRSGLHRKLNSLGLVEESPQ